MSVTAAPQVDPASLLRRARLARGESLEEAAANTRIDLRHLEALEAGAAPESFSSPVYGRLFLRTYGRYLGVDEASLDDAMAAASNGSSHPARRPRNNGSSANRGGAVAGRGPRENGKGLATVTWLRGGPAREAGEGHPVRPGSNGSLVPSRRPALPASEAAARRRARASLLAIGVLGVVLVPTAWLMRGDRGPFGLADPGPSTATASPKPKPLAELPGGGRVIFPGHRVVAYYGAPISARLGILGDGTPDEIAMKLSLQTEAYRTPHLPVLPAMELIATVASHSAGDDGQYRFRLDPSVVDQYLQAARRAHALFIIDVQPGRARFLPEVQVYERWLKEPDVSLALDPEWRVSSTGVPGRELGSVDAQEINEVAQWLSGIVEEGNLPQKLLVVHQFAESMVTSRATVENRPGLALVFDIDGVGGRAIKIQKYHSLTKETLQYHQGLKLFYQTDTDLMTPDIVEGLRPRPDLIIYQ